GYVISEINEHYAPELNNRFVRITRADGTVMYVSGKPKEGGFDPSAVPSLSPPVSEDFAREVHQQGGELLIYTHPSTERTGQRFLIEVGAPYHQIDVVLYGLLLAIVFGLPLMVIVAI